MQSPPQSSPKARLINAVGSNQQTRWSVIACPRGKTTILYVSFTNGLSRCAVSRCTSPTPTTSAFTIEAPRHIGQDNRGEVGSRLAAKVPSSRNSPCWQMSAIVHD